MTVATRKIKALCFDLGNTLIEFGPEQFACQNAALEKALTKLFGHCDAEALKALRDRQYLAPFSNGYRENNPRRLCEELIFEMYDRVPAERHVDKLMQTLYDSFIHVVGLPDGVLPLLQMLRRRYRLGLLSNYPCSRSIRDSLENIGMLEVFDAVAISGDIGYVKPHAKAFAALLSQLGLAPSECAYVGDNWFTDVQGAKRIGMWAILTTQYVPYKSFEPAEGDHVPDMRVDHLNELEEVLLNPDCAVGTVARRRKP